MKLNLLKFSFVFSILFFLAGCISSQFGAMSGSASLGAPNFIYKKQDIVGEALAVHFLGIGGETKQSLILEAKRNMLKENPLLSNQALANVTVSYKSTGFLGFLITTVKCTISADIVEFSPAQTDSSKSQDQSLSTEARRHNTNNSTNKIENMNYEISVDESIKVGDKVKIIHYFSSPVIGKVIGIKKNEFVVEYTARNDKVKQVKVLEFQLEKIK